MGIDTEADYTMQRILRKVFHIGPIITCIVMEIVHLLIQKTYILV